ncbi:MAG: DedA family protein [Alphaproteobacteria bacterium]|nr:DedA family protein [Alphaproteobacteria bacterium]
MHDIYLLIRHHGNLFYFFTFLWTAMEGETFVIFAGLAAQKGLVNFWLLFLSAWIGSFCGDQVFFLAGRYFGTHIMIRLPKLKEPIDRSLGWLERHAAAFILAYRFMYGIRNVSGIAIGMSRLPWRKFMVWNAIAAFIWAAAFAGFGYMFGDVLARLRHRDEIVEGGVRHVMLSALGLFLLIVAFRLAVMAWQRRKVRRPG